MTILTTAARVLVCESCAQRYTVIVGRLIECPDCKGVMVYRGDAKVVEIVQ